MRVPKGNFRQRPCFARKVLNVLGWTCLEREHADSLLVLSCQFWGRMLSCNVREYGTPGGRATCLRRVSRMNRARLISGQIKGIT
jgi:hypothetical protein